MSKILQSVIDTVTASNSVNSKTCSYRVICPDCLGEGTVGYADYKIQDAPTVDKLCQHCEGTGTVKLKATVERVL